MIKRLELENWRSHARTVFDFKKGTNVIVGRMGAGKSSAMDALCYALYGTYPSLQQKKLKLDDVIRYGENKAKVLLLFEKDGDEYQIKRIIERGKGNTYSELKKGSTIIEAPQTKRVTENIVKILGMSYDMFTKAVYSEQNNLEYFLDIPKGKRREKIDELLNINKFEVARKNLNVLIRNLKVKKESRRELEKYSEDLEKIPKIKNEIMELKNRFEQNEKQISELQLKLNEHKKKQEEISLNRELYERLKDAISNKQGALEAIRERLREKPEKSEEELRKEVQEVEEAVKQLEELKAELKGKMEVRKKAELKKFELKSEIERIPSIDVDAELEELKKEISVVEKEIAELESSYVLLSKENSELEENIQKLMHAEEKCPVCGAELSVEKANELAKEKRKRIEENEGRLKEIKVKIEVAKDKRKSLEKKVNDLEQERRRQDKKELLVKQLAEAEEELSGYETEIQKLKQEFNVISKGRGIEELKERRESLVKALEFYENQKMLIKTENELRQLNDELKKVKYSKEVEEEVYNKIKELETKLTALNVENSSLVKQIEDRKEMLQELEKIRKEVEKGREELSFLDEMIESFDILSNVLSKTQGIIREKFTNETNEALKHFWKKIYPYADFTSLRLGIDDAGDYILQLERNGEWINVEGISSGGERTTACLCLRIALASVLAGNLSWLVLDEPTHNLDRQAIRELAQTLREGFSGLVEQIFVITHEEELKEAATASLYMLDRDKEENGATKILLD
ncbi:hypothetical protein DRN74_01515 [Candidatus Micrarchaeota archaeon]|nr:MAG: hypothetical protein DRN74_01515 [Candidatus Micrarchaeota archaeon]